MKNILLSIILICLSFVSNAEENYDKQLNNLFNQLKSTSSAIAAKEIESNPYRRILEIGSNDGVFLKHFELTEEFKLPIYLH